MNDLSTNNNLKSDNNPDQKRTINEKTIALQRENEKLNDVIELLYGQVNNLTLKAEMFRLEFIHIFDAVSDPLCVIDNKYNILRINLSFKDKFQIGKNHSVIGQKCYEVFDLNLCGTKNCILNQIKQKKCRIEVETNLEIKKIQQGTFLQTGAPLYGLAGENIGIVIQFKDISERKIYEKALKEANKKLEDMAKIDGLTQIANRRSFDENLQKEWQHMYRLVKPLSLLMIDVDFFKSYNDYFGHAKGDDCLKCIAKIISSSLKRPHDLAARFGGEEFVCLLPETDLNGAAVVANSILDAMRKHKIPHTNSKVANFVTVSIGGTSKIPEIQDGFTELIIKADNFLYESKLSGRDRMTIK
jgi:diguanylate cyclase (GGDEF)-like protein